MHITAKQTYRRVQKARDHNETSGNQNLIKSRKKKKTRTMKEHYDTKRNIPAYSEFVIIVIRFNYKTPTKTNSLFNIQYML